MTKSRNRLRKIEATSCKTSLLPRTGSKIHLTSNDSRFVEQKEHSTIGTQEGTTEESQEAKDLPASVGSYEIVADLVRGGMGVVYKAGDLRLKRTVALKVVLPGTHAADGECKRFQTEAESVARLKPHNIVQVYKVGESEGHPLLALEYCSGGSMADRLKGRRPSPREAAALVASLSDAMEHSHLTIRLFPINPTSSFKPKTKNFVAHVPTHYLPDELRPPDSRSIR